MSRTHIAVIPPDAAERIAHEAVSWRRWLGQKQEHAMEGAAAALGTTPRRVRALLRGEVFKVLRAEYDAMLARRWADLDRKAHEFRALAEATERQAEAERLAAQQLELDLGAPCFATSRRSSLTGDTNGIRASRRSGGRGTCG